MKLWYGIRFVDYSDTCRTFLNTRSGELTSSSFNATSDILLKKDISNLSNVLENVCKLQGVEFVRMDDDSERKQGDKYCFIQKYSFVKLSGRMS